MLTEWQIDLMIQYGWKLVGLPYKYGGNYVQDGGLDCSGYVLTLLRSVRKWDKTDATAQGIYNRFSKEGYTVPIDTLRPAKGCLLFFGKSTKEITHIALSIGNGSMLEAGGDDKTGSIRPNEITWRKDLVAIINI